MAENSGPLSDRELDVMRLVVRGQTNQEIGHELDISPNTVKVHLRNIFEKLGVASRTEATLVVIREGWVQVEGVTPVDEGALTNGAPDAEAALDSVDSVVAEAPPMVVPPRPTRSPAVWIGSVLVLALVAVLTVIGWQMTRQPQSSPAGGAASTPDRWSTMPALPEARVAAGAVTYAGRIFVVGGRSATAPVTTVAIYDPERDEWHSGAAKPLPVSDAQVAVLGGQLVVPGGVLANGELTNRVEVYVPQEDRWTSAGALPHPLARYALAAYEGRLYVFGGWDGEQVRDEILRYDPEDSQWEQVGRLPTPRAGAAAAELNDLIYVVGGSKADGSALADVVLFRPGPEALIEDGPSMPAVEPAPRLAVLAGNLYLLGASQRLRYDPGAHSWVPLEAPPVSDWEGAALVALDPYVIALGGAVDGQPSAGAWRYQAVYHVFIPGAPGN